MAIIESCTHYRDGREKRVLMPVLWELESLYIEEETAGLCFQRLIQIQIQQKVIMEDWEVGISGGMTSKRQERIIKFATLFISRFLYWFLFPCPYSYNFAKSHSPPDLNSKYQSFLIMAFRIPCCCLLAPESDSECHTPHPPFLPLLSILDTYLLVLT